MGKRTLIDHHSPDGAALSTILMAGWQLISGCPRVDVWGKVGLS